MCLWVTSISKSIYQLKQPSFFYFFFMLLNWIQERIKNIKWFEQETLHIESWINVKLDSLISNIKFKLNLSIFWFFSSDDMRCKDPFVDKSCVIVSCREMGEAELGRDLSPIIYFPNDPIICLIFINLYHRYKTGQILRSLTYWGDEANVLQI